MSTATTYINGLLQDAKCFKCLSDSTLLEVQTYILAKVAGGSLDPLVLAQQAAPLARLSWQSLVEIKVYLLAQIAGFSVSPNQLVTGTICYDCIPPGLYDVVQTYLLSQDPAGPGITDTNALAKAAQAFQRLDATTLLQIQVMLLAQNANVSADPNSLIQAAKCMQCFPYTILIASLISTIDFLEPVPAGSSRTGLPPPTPPPPPPGQPNPVRGGGVQGCTDTLPNLTPVLTPTYVANNLTTVSVLIPRTCCRRGTVDFLGSNAADMSGAVVVTTANLPNRTGNYTLAGVNLGIYGFAYYAARSDCSGGALIGPLSNIVPSFDGTGIATDWANRVVANGGAMPSQASINAVSAFASSLNGSGIWSKMLHVNVIAPDSITAALTPLIVGTGGYAKWKPLGAATYGVTVNGLAVNAGATGGFSAGINLTTLVPNDTNIGLSAYAYTFNNGSYAAGIWSNPPAFTFMDNALGCYCYSTTNTCFSNQGAGFYDYNRSAANLAKLYFAKSTQAHGLVQTDATTNTTARLNGPLGFNCVLSAGSENPFSDTKSRFSFWAIHLSLTQAESSSLFTAVQNLRTAFGGGTI